MAKMMIKKLSLVPALAVLWLPNSYSMDSQNTPPPQAEEEPVLRSSDGLKVLERPKEIEATYVGNRVPLNELLLRQVSDIVNIVNLNSNAEHDIHWEHDVLFNVVLSGRQMAHRHLGVVTHFFDELETAFPLEYIRWRVVSSNATPAVRRPWVVVAARLDPGSKCEVLHGTLASGIRGGNIPRELAICACALINHFSDQEYGPQAFWDGSYPLPRARMAISAGLSLLSGAAVLAAGRAGWMLAHNPNQSDNYLTIGGLTASSLAFASLSWLNYKITSGSLGWRFSTNELPPKDVYREIVRAPVEELVERL